MRTNNLFTRMAAIAAILLTGISISCQDEEVPASGESAYVAEESVTDMYFEDADDMAMVAVASDSRTAGGRVASEAGVLSDDRLCAGVVVSFVLDISSTLLDPLGDITIDFGVAGCTDPRGNIRTGKILIHFDGRRFMPGSVLTITFDNYTINGIKLDGVRTLTNITGSTEDLPKFQVELDGTVEWPDGTDATRTHCYVRQWNRGSLDTLTDDQLIITQCDGAVYAAEGVNRRGIEYKVIINEQLVYKRGCPIAVSGIKTFINVSTGQEIIIDYGDGTCDRAVTITINGTVSTHTVDKG